jgi:hypothetical protein
MTASYAAIEPTECSRYEFDVSAVFLKTGASNLNYVINNKELPTQSPTWTEQEINPDYKPGFEIGARYLFPSHNAFVALNWTNLYNNRSESIAADGVSYFLGPDYEIGPGGLVIRNSTGNAKFWYNVVNLDVGKDFKVDHNIAMRLFTGLGLGSLEEKVTATYYGNRTSTYPGPFSMQQVVKSKFLGIGPRFGARLDYTANNGFGLWGETALSALIGSIKSRTDFTGTSQELLTLYSQAINYQYIADQHVYQVIPGLETKLAAKYMRRFSNNSKLTVSLGWQAAVYINAISQYLPQTLVSGQGIETGGIFVSTMVNKISNYSVQGPFIKFAYAI